MRFIGPKNANIFLYSQLLYVYDLLLPSIHFYFKSDNEKSRLYGKSCLFSLMNDKYEKLLRKMVYYVLHLRYFISDLSMFNGVFRDKLEIATVTS